MNAATEVSALMVLFSLLSDSVPVPAGHITCLAIAFSSYIQMQLLLIVSGVGTPRERSEQTHEVDGNSTEVTAHLMEVHSTCTLHSLPLLHHVCWTEKNKASRTTRCCYKVSLLL